MTHELIQHLLWLLAHSAASHHRWIHYFRAEQPGMPRGWYLRYVTWLISHYPWQMLRVLLGLPSDL